MVYLDNSATTKPCVTAIEKLNIALKEDWGNPSSLYDFGFRAENIVSNTRLKVAEALNCREDEIFFTSGGTEANNLALISAANSKIRKGNRIVTTSVEHPSVLNVCAYLETLGFEVVKISPEKDGSLSAEKFIAAINDKTILVSMMLVNNETGCIFPVKEVAEYINNNKFEAIVHCDAVQAFGKINIDVENLKVDLLSASGHKIHGPKGIGFLYKSKKVNLKPIIFGGGQESGLRSGTESVPLIAGFGGALDELNINKNLSFISELFQYAVSKLSSTQLVTFNSTFDSHLPFVLNFSIKNYRSETVLHFLDSNGVMVSSGSACSKGKGSHVLNEMELDRSTIDSAIRISFSRFNTKEDIDKLCELILKIPNVLRKSKF